MNESSLQLIVGLGNPDKNLLNTRHNVGFWFLDSLSKKFEKKYLKVRENRRFRFYNQNRCKSLNSTNE